MAQPDCMPSRYDLGSSRGVNHNLASRQRRRLRLLVLGVGRILMSDDGVGFHVITEFRKRPHAGVLVTEVGTALLDAVSLLSWADRVIVIDALHAEGAPGTIYWASLSEIHHRTGNLSLHELDLNAALEFMPRDRPQPEIFVLGVQPGSLDMGLELSSPVTAAIPEALLILEHKLAQWRKERRQPR